MNKTLRSFAASSCVLAALGVGAANAQPRSAGAASGVTAPDAGRPNVLVAAPELAWIRELPTDTHRLVKLWGDRTSGQAGILLELPSGFDSGWHAHTADYRAVVISGTWLHVGQDSREGARKRLTAGSYWTRRRDEMHKDECVSTQACIIFVFSEAGTQPDGMSFFVTSVGPGKGGDLGGLDGADRHCRSLAHAVGAGSKTWRAYLSTQGAHAINARERIGRGPWRNAKGIVIARDLVHLHGANGIAQQTALTEKGDIVNGPSASCLSNLRRGVACAVQDPPNVHDILTGSQPDGNAFAAREDSTCRNWTKSASGAARVGHSDRTGLDESAPMISWNSSHPSRGCSQDDLRSTGGNGLFYCFAAD